MSLSGPGHLPAAEMVVKTYPVFPAFFLARLHDSAPPFSGSGELAAPEGGGSRPAACPGAGILQVREAERWRTHWLILEHYFPLQIDLEDLSSCGGERRQARLGLWGMTFRTAGA